MARVELVPASGISSELSSHQMSQSASSPSIHGLLALYWTLVDQSVIPPGFEDVFVGFSEAWTEAAPRADRVKSLWNNETAAVTLAAQRKAHEETVRLERHSKDRFLLAAIQRPAAFRTRLQKIAYEGATARKDTSSRG